MSATWTNKNRLKSLAQHSNVISCINTGIVLFFYLLSYMLTSAIENQFYLDKVCLTNYGYNRTVCNEIGNGNHTEVQVEIQKQVAHFLIYNTIVRQVLPVIPGFLLAIWTDRHGARTAIIIGMVGKTVYYAGYIFNAYFLETMPVENVLLMSALPRAIAGYDIGIFMAVFSHLAEATPPEELTMRLAVLETVNQISVPIGLNLGSLIFRASGKSYTTAYISSMTVSGFGLLYALLFLKNLPHHSNNPKSVSWDDVKVLSALKATCQHREDNSRQTIIMLLAMIFFHSMMYDSPLLYLYSQLKFQWNIQSYSNLLTVESIFSTVVVAFIVPMLKKKPQISDIHVLICGVMLTIISRFCYAFSEHEEIMYLGAAASGFQVLTLVSIRSMISKISTSEDRGKVLSMCTSVESGAGLVSSPLYNKVYTATILAFPSAIFIISIALQSCILLFIVILISVPQHSNNKDKNNECKLVSIRKVPEYGR